MVFRLLSVNKMGSSIRVRSAVTFGNWGTQIPWLGYRLPEIRLRLAGPKWRGLANNIGRPRIQGCDPMPAQGQNLLGVGRPIG